jgi:triphosphoribosyl-dephospho-CoA synthase
MNMHTLSPEHIAALVRESCMLDVQAFKPGNVSFAAPGHGMTADQFVHSADAMIGPLTRSGASVGSRILDAVAATRAKVGCNTNLGIVLLLAPLVQAALAASPLTDLRARLGPILRGLSVADAEHAFAAIRIADPGGLGADDGHDVRNPAAVDLRAAMGMAEDRDRIARQFVTDYEDVFCFGVPLALRAMGRYGDETWAAVDVFLRIFGRWPDTHIARKFGQEVADAACEEAREVQARFLATSPQAAMPLLQRFDGDLKKRGLNPGTSADLTVAVFVAVRLQQAIEKIANDRPVELTGGVGLKRAIAREFYQLS